MILTQPLYRSGNSQQQRRIYGNATRPPQNSCIFWPYLIEIIRIFFADRVQRSAKLRCLEPEAIRRNRRSAGNIRYLRLGGLDQGIGWAWEYEVRGASLRISWLGPNTDSKEIKREL